MTAPGRKLADSELAYMPAGTVKANLGTLAASPTNVTLAALAAALPGGGGSITGASNVGASGVGAYDSVSGTTLQFRKVDAGSAAITVTLVGSVIVVDVGAIPESSVTNLVSDLSNKVPTSRTISTTAPITGGGDLSANRTLALSIDSSLAVSSGNLQRATLTGDVTASAGSNATTIAADVVTYAKMQNISAASRVVGRGSASGAGDPEELTLGASLVMNATSIERAALTGDVTASQNGNATTIASHVVTNAKAAQMAANTVKSNLTGSTADAADNTLAALLAALGSGYYGDGSDGVPGTAGVLANTTLTADVFWLGNVSVPNGVTLTMGNFRVHTTGSFTVDSGGIVEMDGAAGSGSSAGTFRGAGGSLAVATSGGAGSSSTVGQAGGSVTASTSTGAIGGSGGAGGTGGANAGGAGGVANRPTAASGGYRTTARLYQGMIPGVTGNTTAIQVGLRPGCGGGGGASNGGGGVGGGGGSGAGWAMICAPTITNNGTIRANGGAGANGTTSGAGQGGGGGGGGGGVVLLVTANFTGTTPTASGGAHGTGAGGGGAGTDGSGGLVCILAP